jgi:hypothetical protein
MNSLLLPHLGSQIYAMGAESVRGQQISTTAARLFLLALFPAEVKGTVD